MAKPPSKDEAPASDENSVPVSIPENAVAAEIEDQDDAAEFINWIVAEARVHQGPLPSPEQLAAYERVVEGSARQIIGMAAKEQDFSHGIARSMLWHRTFTYNFGAICGLVTALALIGAGTYLAIEEHTAVALAAFGTGAVGMVTAFLKWTGGSRGRDSSEGKSGERALAPADDDV